MAKGTGIPGKTPGDGLKKLIEQNGLSLRATAIALGENQITLRAVTQNKKRVGAKLALKLAKVFGNTAGEWLNLQQTYDLAEAKNDSALAKQLENMKKAGQIESGRGKGPGKAASGGTAAKKPAAKGPAGKKAAAKGAAAKKPAAKKMAPSA